MPGVVFVLGRDPERWLVELNQPAHKLNFQHTYFEGSFKLITGLLFINLPTFPDQFRSQKLHNKAHRSQIKKTEAKLLRHCNINRARILQAA
ncbi:MAG: hypothetical protein VX934_03990 [Cyanobacteriota bacterium]|nr:hypothetical protein [Cyanobacteriota bacterium]